MQWARKQKYSGFTIVELIIVIAVIAILAVIATVSYRGVTDKARSVAVKNSLDNASADLQRLALRSGVPTQIPSSIKPDNDVVLQLAGSAGTAKDFCVNAFRISSYEVGSYDSSTGEMRSYPCAGAFIGSPVGGSVPTVPIGKNLTAPDFSEWKLTGGVTYNKDTKELVFSGTSGNAMSPLVWVGGASTTTSFGLEMYSSASSVTYAPLAGFYSGSAYYAANGTTSAQSTAGYSSNGNAQSVPLNAWTARSWPIATGPNVHYVRYIIYLSPSGYTSNNFKVRNPSIERRG